MYKIAKENLSALFQAIAGEQELFVPVNNNGQVNFAAWTEGANVDLDTLKTVKSPKDAEETGWSSFLLQFPSKDRDRG